MIDWLVSDKVLAVIGGLGAWYLAFAHMPSIFSEVDLRFKYLVRWKVTKKSMQRDYKWKWKKLPLSAYWVVFVLWHLLLTAGAFLLVWLIALSQWKWAKNEEPAIGLHAGLQGIGAIMVLLVVFGLITRAVGF